MLFTFFVPLFLLYPSFSPFALFILLSSTFLTCHGLKRSVNCFFFLWVNIGRFAYHIAINEVENGVREDISRFTVMKKCAQLLGCRPQAAKKLHSNKPDKQPPEGHRNATKQKLMTGCNIEVLCHNVLSQTDRQMGLYWTNGGPKCPECLRNSRHHSQVWCQHILAEQRMITATFLHLDRIYF